MLKRDDLIRGALTVFARDGYVKARIVDIATEAGVSTRTIYNQFEDKAGLFAAVVEAAATAVVDHRVAMIEARLGAGHDVVSALVGFATEWINQPADFAPYMQLARRVEIERNHIPQEILDRGMAQGPERVHRALALHLEHYCLTGELRAIDPGLAAIHLLQLVEGAPAVRGFFDAAPPSAQTLTVMATQAVHAYLWGYGNPQLRPEPGVGETAAPPPASADTAAKAFKRRDQS